MIKVGIVGATGYAGLELLRLLARHPQAEVAALTSRQHAGTRVDSLFPHLRGVCDLSYATPDEAPLSDCDVVFFATPHGAAMAQAPALVQAGVRIIDVSADFRLHDPALYERWYKQPHQCPDLLQEAVYGLPELHRDAIRSARVIGNPGCYPTSVQLAMLPLVEAGVVDASHIIANCASGVSGAGRTVREDLLYCESADNFRAYGVNGHRHSAEIDQELAEAADAPVKVLFVPHLTPLIRGIHSTVYAPIQNDWKGNDDDLQALFNTRYADEPFVDVLPSGSCPDTRSVRGTNLCRLAVHRPGGSDTAVVLAVIDNLVKGAAGQAVQCFNLMFGCDEDLALAAPALCP
ncbi:MAG: N-acetyl-gamma-glutamyl-phosphate reductase [Sinobacteraceae bacterium]|nr:N-acetyl-gamma-glutamyl-phosphate reductase [Nevskiaceae bacterium]